MSSILTTNSNSLRINQPCTACTDTNCWRCMATNTSKCISCMFGNYLITANNTCTSCPSKCLVCLNADVCLFCSLGFVDTQVGTIMGDSPVGIQNCVQCSSACLTCEGNPDTCTSCNSGFTLNSGACISNFNYIVAVSFDVTLQVFEQNFFNFLQRDTSLNLDGVATRKLERLWQSSLLDALEKKERRIRDHKIEGVVTHHKVKHLICCRF